MISFRHDKWGWSQSLFTPISVHFQVNTVPVQGAMSKVQNAEHCSGYPQQQYKDIAVW